MGAAGAGWTGDAAVAAARRRAIGQFWSWWTEQGAVRTARAIEAGQPQQVVDDLSARVSAIDDGLAWELGPGWDSSHVLVLSCDGDPRLRPVARRWRMSAPAADGTWQYSDVRPASPDPEGMVLQIGDVQLDAARASADVRVVGDGVDLVVHHPGFDQLPEPVRDTATFVLLHAVLGEADVETWVAGIASSTTAALDAVPLAGVRSVVDDLRAEHLDPDGNPTWSLLSGQTPDGGAIIASAQVPLRAACAPHLDTYVAVAVPYADRTDEGLPGPASLGPLRDLEDHVGRLLGDSGRVVAHQSHDGVRILHVYVDGTTPAAEQLRVGVSGWDQGPVELDVQPDPGWDAVQHLRG